MSMLIGFMAKDFRIFTLYMLFVFSEGTLSIIQMYNVSEMQKLKGPCCYKHLKQLKMIF